MKITLILILVVILTAGCTQTTPLIWICPDGTEVLGGPNQCPETNETNEATIQQTALCKGTARCFDGTITKIVDGDTLEVNNVSIRLALVDAPEYDKVEGKEAKDFVSSICPVGSATKVDEDDGQTEGSYGRIIAAIYCNKITLNAELITNGYATIYEEFCDVSEFADEYWAKNYGC